MRRVPLVLTDDGDVAQRFSSLLGQMRSDVAGREGILLDITGQLGPEPSVLVDAASGDGLDRLLDAVHAGHAAVTADVAKLVHDPAGFAVLRADRRLGMAAALLPGLPLVHVLARERNTGNTLVQVELEGDDLDSLIDEAVAVAALLGAELRREHVRVDATDARSGSGWRAVVGQGLPTVSRADARSRAGTRTAVVTIGGASGVKGVFTMRGPAADADRIARELLADVLTLAREGDSPWRAYRRRTGGGA